jgi:LmbE family N-acetylglucosaminyl deacetylase
MKDTAAPCANPGAVFDRRIIVVSPHIDDETLGCGALMALLSATHEIHVVFATDSSRSPEHPLRPGADGARIAALREEEAATALQVLGVLPRNLHFLRLPDGALQQHLVRLRTGISATLASIGTADVLVPFRHDWHPDHLAVHAAASAAYRAGDFGGRIVEYFVYTQRRLLPGGDIRAFADPGYAVRVDGSAVANLKKRALLCFRTQTTRFFDWQTRPILTGDLVDRMCRDPECFLPHRDGLPAPVRAEGLVRLATTCEPRLKRLKDRTAAWLRQ